MSRIVKFFNSIYSLLDSIEDNYWLLLLFIFNRAKKRINEIKGLPHYIETTHYMETNFLEPNYPRLYIVHKKTI